MAMKDADSCCGLGGPWGLMPHYDLAVELRKDKINNIVESKADAVASWCSGCMIQMREGLQQANSQIQVKHPLELLADACK